jgi:pyruvate kinase
MGPRTHIICTLGPSSGTLPVLKRMTQAGMDIARINFSHGTRESHQRQIDLVRVLNRAVRGSVRILTDLEGHRIRIGRFKGRKSISLKKHQIVWLAGEASASGNDIPFDYNNKLGGLKAGKLIYIDDGQIALRTISVSGNRVKAEVMVPGVLKEHKGINIPDVNIRFNGLTDKDRADLGLCAENRVDFIAQSFVQDKADILNVREAIRACKMKCGIIAKIENRKGIANLDEILDVADGIMIARGDLGVSLPIYEIPMFQKEIIRKCRARKKLAITATQMLESMTEYLRPTRAEVSDVANAVLDGTDFVMLSGETAVGRHPVEAVRMMEQVIIYTESKMKHGRR